MICNNIHTVPLGHVSVPISTSVSPSHLLCSACLLFVWIAAINPHFCMCSATISMSILWQLYVFFSKAAVENLSKIKTIRLRAAKHNYATLFWPLTYSTQTWMYQMVCHRNAKETFSELHSIPNWFHLHLVLSLIPPIVKTYIRSIYLNCPIWNC